MAANRQTDIHTHVRNAVTLVWGSLRLAPNIVVRKKGGLNKQQTTEEVLKRWKRRDNDNTIDQKIFTFNKDFVIL